MAIKSIHEILTMIDNVKDVEARKAALRQANAQVPAAIQVIRLAMDSNLQFALPPGDPPYKPCEAIDQHGRLHQEIRKMQYFMVGGPDIHQTKREVLFIQVLESIDPEDAKLLLHAKNKKLPYKKITRKIVEETFPGMLSDEQK